MTITAGSVVERIEEIGHVLGLRVPKKHLASTVQVLLQEGRLRIGRDLPHAGTLTAEMQNFKAKINPNGHVGYGAGDDWRDGNHDDLVLALALACWLGEWATRRVEIW